MTDQTPHLPEIGDRGTAAEFQLSRLRDWGLDDYADAGISREQALILYHCALYVRNVWRDLEGLGSQPDRAAVRHCVTEMMRRPDMVERAERLTRAEAIHDDWEDDLKSDETLYDEVARALGQFSGN